MDPNHSTSFDPARYFPPRRRAVRACRACRHRKSRCDEASPKCSLCVDLNIDCVYLDSQQQPKIDTNTRILLERIQSLEDRLFAAPSMASPSLNAPDPNDENSIPTPAPAQASYFQSSKRDSTLLPSYTAEATPPVQYAGSTPDPILDADGSVLTMPPAHYATANHVYRWPILQAILGRISVATYLDRRASPNSYLPEATDAFFLNSREQDSKVAPESWRLFQNDGPPNTSSPSSGLDWEHSLTIESRISNYRDLIEEYFLNVHVFFPMLRKDHVCHTLSSVVKSECDRQLGPGSVPKSQYCLLLLVLCLGSFVKSNNSLLYSSNRARFAAVQRRLPQNEVRGEDPHADLEDQYWEKASLLLGSITSDKTLEAAQCYTLASIFLGAKGRVIDAYQHIHVAATKCEIIVKRSNLEHREQRIFSDSFCRLFWIVYVYESDFVSEISLTPPSGITRFEEMVAYPTSEGPQIDTDADMDMREAEPSLCYEAQRNDQISSPNTSPFINVDMSELTAFQISTNSAIRRFFNRVNAVIYNENEAWRKKNHETYATWLLKIASELRAHQDAIHQNLPAFLLTNDLAQFRPGETQNRLSHSGNQEPRYKQLLNHNWNIARLKGRRCAGQYVIHRPFIEYVLLNPVQLDIHPSKLDILDKCRMCLEGCHGFINIFSAEPANCITNLFSTGMATFTMVIILMVSAACPSFRPILPADVEEAIAVGQQNLRRFSMSVKEFEWHIKELERLDGARRAENISDLFGPG